MTCSSETESIQKQCLGVDLVIELSWWGGVGEPEGSACFSYICCDAMHCQVYVATSHTQQIHTHRKSSKHSLKSQTHSTETRNK